MNRHGFTLIELLVVITIIVVLLALLTPALDKAIYEAELTVCAAQQSGIGRGVGTYAAANKRRYPHRPRVADNDGNRQPHDLSAFDDESTDERPILRTIFSLNALVDPLSEEVDLDIGENGLAQFVTSSYCMWWGWRYNDGTSHRGMFKLGDRFSWTGPDQGGRIRTGSFNLLLSDRDHLQTGQQAVNSHPDKAGVMSPLTLQESTDNPWLPYAATVTFSAWRVGGTDQRGDVDLNFLAADGSVSRTTDAEPYDQRLFPVPNRLDNNSVEERIFIVEN